MPWCYCDSGGYGRFLERRSQPLSAPEREPDPEPSKKTSHRPRPVECVETRELYASPTAAAAAQPRCADGRKIRGACFRPETTAYGFHWRFADATVKKEAADAR